MGALAINGVALQYNTRGRTGFEEHGQHGRVGSQELGQALDGTVSETCQRWRYRPGPEPTLI